LAASVVYAVMRKETPVGAYVKERFDPAEWNLNLVP